MSKLTTDKCLMFYGDRCTGCRICEMICSSGKHQEYNPAKSYIRILKNWELDVNIAALDLRCDYCGRCISWCPTAAIAFVSPAEAAILRKDSAIGTFPAPLIGPDRFVCAGGVEEGER